MGKNNTQVINIQYKKILEEKLYALRDENRDVDIEHIIGHFFVSELISHGKDASQIYQTAKISKLLGEVLGLDVDTCHVLEDAAKMYDVGNLVIHKDIYIKEEKLTFEEFFLVKTHTTLGYEILKFQGFPSTNLAAIISSEHHEWWDGGGYANKRKHTFTDISSRIVAVADTVGALCKKRPGRVLWAYEKIVEYVIKRSGTQFDPEVVNAFIAKKEEIYDVLYIDIENVSYM